MSPTHEERILEVILEITTRPDDPEPIKAQAREFGMDMAKMIVRECQSARDKISPMVLISKLLDMTKETLQ